MTILKDVWVLTIDGIPVYHQSLESDLDESLFGGFMSAICTFIEEMGEKDLSQLEMAGSKIRILRSEDKRWLFVGRSDIKIKDKKIEKYLREIRDIFYREYNSILPKWNGDVSCFDGMDSYIDLTQSETPEKLQQDKEQRKRGGFL